MIGQQFQESRVKWVERKMVGKGFERVEGLTLYIIYLI